MDSHQAGTKLVKGRGVLTNLVDRRATRCLRTKAINSPSIEANYGTRAISREPLTKHDEAELLVEGLGSANLDMLCGRGMAWAIIPLRRLR